ncbi:MAG: NADH-quinone oxidoreductase subunit C [Candidatus Omnitrophota bacterium]
MIKDEIQNNLKNKIKEWVVKNPKRIYFAIDKKDIKDVAKFLYKDMAMRLSTISGIDNEKDFELLYHFSFDKTGEIFNVRVFLDKENPEIDSLVEIFKASNWVEREIHEMLGIKFIGHPKLTHFLLDDDWPKDDFPLRKSRKNG